MYLRGAVSKKFKKLGRPYTKLEKWNIQLNIKDKLGYMLYSRVYNRPQLRSPLLKGKTSKNHSIGRVDYDHHI